jgi:hypothetical protein
MSFVSFCLLGDTEATESALAQVRYLANGAIIAVGPSWYITAFVGCRSSWRSLWAGNLSKVGEERDSLSAAAPGDAVAGESAKVFRACKGLHAGNKRAIGKVRLPRNRFIFINLPSVMREDYSLKSTTSWPQWI